MSDKKAEHLIAEQGVFKGHEGLRGLYHASEFWGNMEGGHHWNLPFTLDFRWCFHA